jgi:adenylosuccinate synthase
MEGWQQPIGAIRQYNQLPSAAQAYIRKIEELVGVPVRIVSVGVEREAIIWKS